MSVEFNSGDRRSADLMALNLVDIFRIDGKDGYFMLSPVILRF